ncbi:MAG: hypothetical protein AAFX54_09355 [Pseudomonadota bacterium]
MLLRRITEHVKAQNWTAVALDFVIVVVGVFIGIQVSNWNDVRVENARTVELKERLLEDFELLAEGIRQGEARVSYYAQTADEVYALLVSGGTPQDAAPFGQKLNVAGSSQPAVGAAPTFSEMLSTGDVRLIENKALRSALVEYHLQAAQSEKTSEIFLPRFLEAIEGLDPYIIRGPRDPETGFPVVESYDLAALRENAGLFQRLSRINSDLQQIYAYQLELAEAVLVELENESN